MGDVLTCRSGCGACCIAPSIASSFKGHPHGKIAGEPCVNLDLDTFNCSIWGQEEYPEFCHNFKPCSDVCGDSREEALQIITLLERSTKP